MPRADATPALLLVDLGAGTVRRHPVEASPYSLYYGGRGLAAALMASAPATSWDDPGARIAIVPGRLAGLGLPGAGQATVAFVSPVTGGLVTASLGGRLAGVLARCALAGVVVTGRAPAPVGLAIRRDGAALVAAGSLWGQDLDAVFAALGAFDAVAAVGPAAVAGSPLALLAADRWFAPGRGGLGLALAAKGLAYVAASGQGTVPVADPAGLVRAREAMERLVAAAPALSGSCGFGRHGTAALADLTAGRRMLPTNHFRATAFPPGEAVNAPRLGRRFAASGRGCPDCPVACRRVTPEGRLLPDVDALCHATALVGLADAPLAVAAQEVCRRAGLDPVSALVTLACRAELTGEALSPSRVLHGLRAMAAMAGGEGRELGRGCVALAAAFGQPETAMCVKGVELPAFDPRGAYGLALALAVSPSGPDPWSAGCLAHELLRKPVATDRFTFEGKARAVHLGENGVAGAACLGGCPYFSIAISLEEWALALGAVTGRAVSAGELARLGERTVLTERLVNARRGLGVAEDDLPRRFFTEPGSDGEGIAVPPLDRTAFETARGRYYRLRGLDAVGRPLADRLAALEVPWTR